MERVDLSIDARDDALQGKLRRPGWVADGVLINGSECSLAVIGLRRSADGQTLTISLILRLNSASLRAASLILFESLVMATRISLRGLFELADFSL
jgi:hypothetical protein